MFKKTIIGTCILFATCGLANGQQYYNGGQAPSWQPNTFQTPQVTQGQQFMPQVGVQGGDLNGSGWRAGSPRQPDFYHYHEHRIMQQQQCTQYYQPQQYCVPQTQYYYVPQCQQYYYPQRSYWGW